MAVSVVVHQARAQPHHALEAEVAQKPLLDFLARQAVPIGVQEALLGRDRRAGAVVLDRAAFHDPIRFLERQPGRIGEPFADVLVALQLVLAAPAVEAEALRAALPARADDDRSGVAQPDVAELLDDHLSERRQPSSVLRGSVVLGDQPHLLAAAAGMDRRGERRDLAFRRL